MSILVLVIILYFVYTYNSERYEFLIYMGDEQAQLVGGYGSVELTKTYIKQAAKQVAYEEIYDLTNHAALPDQTCFSSVNCDTLNERLNSLSLSEIINLYEINEEYGELYMPNIMTTVTCDSNQITLNGYGFVSLCADVSPVPILPCIDQVSSEACSAVVDSEGNSGACTWVLTITSGGSCQDNADGDEQKCPNLLAESAADCPEDLDCEWQGCLESPTVQPAQPCSLGIDGAATCNAIRGCKWFESYTEPIQYFSLPFEDFQFEVELDPHFEEKITCLEYNSFRESRDANTAPSCSLELSRIGSSTYTYKVTYTDADNHLPRTIEVITDTTSTILFEYGQISQGVQTDPADTDFTDGKDYEITVDLPSRAQYDYTLTCTDNTPILKMYSKSGTWAPCQLPGEGSCSVTVN